MFDNTKWIFFDIGSTLVDEQYAYNHRIKDMIAGTNLTFEEVDAKRIEFFKQGLDGNTEIISYFGLNKTRWHSEDEILYKDVPTVLEYLYSKNYKLGIIANQIKGALQRLQNFGIAHYFNVFALSAELGVAKPDTRIFEKALNLAQCDARYAVMVGDRLDNDIIPAKQYGMQTIWLRNAVAHYQPIKLANGYADTIIEDIKALIQHF